MQRNGQAYSASLDLRAAKLKILREILDHVSPDNKIEDSIVLAGGTKIMNEIIDGKLEILKNLQQSLTPEFYEALIHINEYMSSEKAHYDQCSEDEQKNHIWLDVQVVNRFLGGREK